jgi:hypothetical protein
MLAALAFMPARAQDNRLTTDTRVTGSLPVNGVEDWTLTAPAGAVISLLARATSGTLDPQITILSGTDVLISNDDLNYPDVRDAALEAIALPRTGSYTVRVSAFGGTSGDYALDVHPGYLDNPLRDDFDEVGGWTAEDALLQISAADGRLRLRLDGLQQEAAAVNADAIAFADFFATLDIAALSGRGGGQVGIIVREAAGSGYRYEISPDRGQWRFVQQTTSDDRVLRDWTAHPAIVAGTERFSLGVLAVGARFDLFYSGQIIGTLRDSTLTGAGRIGFTVSTGTALDSTLTAEFDSLIVTTPADPAVFPQRLVVADGATMVQELERRGLIRSPRIELTVDESFVESARAGVSALPLGRGARYTRFVMAATISGQAGYVDAPTGCGLIMRSTAPDAYWLAYVNQNGTFGLSQRTGSVFAPGLYGSLSDGRNGSHHLLLIVGDDTLHYYIDGRHQGALPVAAEEGEIGLAAINYEPVTVSCSVRDVWVAAFGE